MEFFLSGSIFVGFIFVLRSVLAVVGLVLGKKIKLNREKLSSFECGFDPLDRSRNTFSLRFFLLAIVFLIFDIELVLFLPYILRLVRGVGVVVKIIMRGFVVILLLGLAHELNEGSLD